MIELEELKDKAWKMTKAAIQSGVLVRPSHCSRCGVKDKKAVDGRTLIHAHHPNYSEPLRIEWLCVQCHRDSTPVPSHGPAPVFGERNGQAKLNAKKVRFILRSKRTAVELAPILGVSFSTVCRVRRGEHWVAATKQEADHE